MKKHMLCVILTIAYTFLLASTAFADSNQNNLNPNIESQQVQTFTSETTSNIIRSACIGVINTDGVRVRSAPSLSGTIRGLLYKGDVLELADETYSGDGYTWYAVINVKTGVSGYVVANYVDIYPGILSNSDIR